MAAGRLKLLVGIAVSAAALYFLFSGIRTEGLLQAASRLSVGGLLGAVLLLGCGYVLRVVRWWWMLRAFAPRLQLAHCFTPYLSSIALNNVLPLRAGDAIRTFGFRRQLGVPVTAVLGTVIIERLLDLAMLLALFFAGAARVPAASLPPGLAGGAAVLAFVSLTILVALPLAGPWLSRKLRDFGTSGDIGRKRNDVDHANATAQPWMAKLQAGARDLFNSFSLLRSVRSAAGLLPLTLLIWGFEGATFVAVSLDLSLKLGLAAPYFAMTTGTLATLLPSTPGYVGTFDYFTMLGLSAFDVSREVATAFSLSVHAVLWAPITAIGLVLLALHGGRAAFSPDPTDAALESRRVH